MGQWQGADWIEFRPIATDPEVMRYITGGVAWDDETIRSFVDRQVEMYRQHGFCRWKLTERLSGQMVGFCGVGRWGDYSDLEIGWWLARSYWGRGLATEAAKIALQDIFQRVGVDRVISVAKPANTASTRIMEKIGLEFEREFENEGVQLVQYGISRAEYITRLSAKAGSC